MAAMCNCCTRQGVNVVIPTVEYHRFNSACHGAISVVVPGICSAVSS